MLVNGEKQLKVVYRLDEQLVLIHKITICSLISVDDGKKGELLLMAEKHFLLARYTRCIKENDCKDFGSVVEMLEVFIYVMVIGLVERLTLRVRELKNWREKGGKNRFVAFHRTAQGKMGAGNSGSVVVKVAVR